MVSKILLWTGFGIAVRLWQLGIQMRPIIHPKTLWVYGVYGTIGGSFGYWLQGVEQRQLGMLQAKREQLLEKRRKVAERQGGINAGSENQRLVDGIVPIPEKKEAEGQAQ